MLVAIGMTAALIVGITIIDILVQGWALYVLWGWFVSSALGLPQISIPLAMGIVIIIALLKGPERAKHSGVVSVSAWLALAKPIIVRIITAVVCVGLGWIVVQFV